MKVVLNIRSPLGLLAFAVVAVLLSSVDVWAQSDRKPPPPKSPTRLTDEQVRELASCWRRDQRPSMLLVCSVEDDKSVTFDPGADALAVKTYVEGQLIRALPGGGIVAPGYQELRDRQAADAMKRAAGSDLGDDARLALGSAFKAEIVIELVIVKHGDRVTARYRAVDTRTSSDIGTFPISKPIPISDSLNQARLATAIASKFVEHYCEFTNGVQKRVLNLIGYPGKIDLEKATRRLPRDIERNIEGVDGRPTCDIKRTENELLCAELAVYYEGAGEDLIFDLEDEVLAEAGLLLKLWESDGHNFVGQLFPDEVPEWWRITDDADAGFEDAVRKRMAGLSKADDPRLAIVVGEDLKDRTAVYDDPNAVRVGGMQGMDHDQLAGALGEWFRLAGFKTPNAAALRDRIRKARQRNERFNDLPHLARSLEDRSDFECLLYVNAIPSDGGSYRLNAELVDLETANTLGFQSWPDQAATWHPTYRVHDGDLEGMARFIAGNLLNRWDRLQRRDPARTLDVLVKNVQSQAEVMQLIELVQGIREVKDIARMNISKPTASFEVVYGGSKDDLLMKVINQNVANSLGFPWDIDASSANQMVIDLRRQVRLPVESSTPKLDPTLSADAADLEMAPEPSDDFTAGMRAAGRSVALMGVEVDGQFFIGGTGWVVRPDLLATNAHVLQALESIRDDAIGEGGSDEAIRFVARHGKDQKKTLVLSKSELWTHPGYGKWRLLEAQYRAATADQTTRDFYLIPGYDVGLIRITAGDPGPALPLASSDGSHLRLRPMDRVGYVGFPAENLPGNTPPLMFPVGRLVSLTDFFLETGEAGGTCLLHYDLNVQGGASGSPVIGPDGKVVGVNSASSFSQLLTVVADDAGNLVPAGVVRVSAGVSYGQRVDVLQELLDTVE